MSNPLPLATLRVPLAVKLVGANLAVVVALVTGWLVSGGSVNTPVVTVVVLVVAAHLGLVLVALRPIRDLELVASRVWNGELGARVAQSRVADTGVLRIGSMFNILLDGLASDRARMRALAAEVIAVGDRERAALAVELHDSTAQRVAALLLQLSAAARESTDPALAQRLRESRDFAEGILDEVRLISQTVYPGVLDNLGLEPALRKLARDSANGSGVGIIVNAELGEGRLPHTLETALYRVAQEAVRNATRHAQPHSIRIDLACTSDAATLSVLDDGAGFDVGEAERRRPGTGLLSMRERVSLVDGHLRITSSPGRGTTVLATVPRDANRSSSEVSVELRTPVRTFTDGFA